MCNGFRFIHLCTVYFSLLFVEMVARVQDVEVGCVLLILCIVKEMCRSICALFILLPGLLWMLKEKGTGDGGQALCVSECVCVCRVACVCRLCVEEG